MFLLARWTVERGSPGDAEGQVAQVALDDVDREAELVERLLLEPEVAELDIARPDADVELVGVEVVDLRVRPTSAERELVVGVVKRSE